jgi:hypothetical protein
MSACRLRARPAPARAPVTLSSAFAAARAVRGGVRHSPARAPSGGLGSPTWMGFLYRAALRSELSASGAPLLRWMDPRPYMDTYRDLLLHGRPSSRLHTMARSSAQSRSVVSTVDARLGDKIERPRDSFRLRGVSCVLFIISSLPTLTSRYTGELHPILPRTSPPTFSPRPTLSEGSSATKAYTRLRVSRITTFLCAHTPARRGLELARVEARSGRAWAWW